MKKSLVRLVNHLSVSDLTRTYSSSMASCLEKKYCVVKGSVNYLGLIQVIGNGQDEESWNDLQDRREKRHWEEEFVPGFKFFRAQFSPQPGLMQSFLTPADRAGLISGGFRSGSQTKHLCALERRVLSHNWIFIKGKQPTDTKRRIQWNSTWLNNKSSSISLSPPEPV